MNCTVSGLHTCSNFQIPSHSPTGLPSVGGFGCFTVSTSYGASHTQKGLIINGGFTDTDTDTDTGRKRMMSPYNLPLILSFPLFKIWYVIVLVSGCQQRRLQACCVC